MHPKTILTNTRYYMETNLTKNTNILLLLGLMTAICFFSLLLFFIGTAKDNLSVFVLLTLFFMIYTPIYIHRQKERTGAAKYIQVAVCLAGVLALTGGILYFSGKADVGNILILAAGATDGIALFIVLLDIVYRFCKNPSCFLVDSATLLKSILWGVPVFYFPFLINVICEG